MRYLQYKYYHYLLKFNKIEILRFLFIFYYKINKKYVKNILYSKIKPYNVIGQGEHNDVNIDNDNSIIVTDNDIFINKLINKYPLNFNYILGMKLKNNLYNIKETDYLIFNYLLNILNIKYRTIYLNLNDINKIFDIISKQHNSIFYIYYTIIMQDNAYKSTHMCISYNDKLYNILNNDEKIYLYISCVINSFCFILESSNIYFEVHNLLCIFFILQNCLNFKLLNK